MLIISPTMIQHVPVRSMLKLLLLSQMTNKYFMLKKYRVEVGRLIIASHVFILAPILQLHNKYSCSLYITCQLTSPTVYSCGSSLIHAEVFQVPYSCVQCCWAKLCEIEVNPAILPQFCQPIITVNALGLVDPLCFMSLKVTIHIVHFGVAMCRSRHRGYL